MVAKKKVNQKVKEKTVEPEVENITLSILAEAQRHIKSAINLVTSAEKAFKKEHKKSLRGK